MECKNPHLLPLVHPWSVLNQNLQGCWARRSARVPFDPALSPEVGVEEPSTVTFLTSGAGAVLAFGAGDALGHSCHCLLHLRQKVLLEHLGILLRGGLVQHQP